MIIPNTNLSLLHVQVYMDLQANTDMHTLVCVESGIYASLVPRPLRIRHLQYEIILKLFCTATASDECAKAWERG